MVEADLPKDFNPSTWSSIEFQNSSVAPALVFKHSAHVWKIYEDDQLLLIAGIYAPSLMGSTPELWLLVDRAFEKNLRQHVRICRELMNQLLTLYPYVKVQVNEAFAPGLHFAKFFGFEYDHTTTLANGKTYEVLECHSTR